MWYQAYSSFCELVNLFVIKLIFALAFAMLIITHGLFFCIYNVYY